MENCSTPLPVPKLHLFRDFSLCEKKSVRKEEVRSCPRLPAKSNQPISVLHHKFRTSLGGAEHGGGSVHRSARLSRARSVTFSKQQSSESVSHLAMSQHTQSPALTPDVCNTDEDDEQYFNQYFQLVSKLGSGSFGEVFKVRDPKTGQLFALKKSRERFKGRIDRLRKLEEVKKLEQNEEHENCVKFYQAWEEKGFLFIQTELCTMNLCELMESNPDDCLSEDETWHVLTDMLSALDHLSGLQLVHLDIKPANIFVGQDFKYKLGDFGLMISLAQDSLIPHAEPQEGDPKYLAPELMDGQFTLAADVFSLGISLLECVSGLELPRSGEWWHLIRQSLNNIPQDHLKKVSKDLLEIITLMMLRDHLKRPTVQYLLALPSIVDAIIRRKTHLEELSFTAGSPLKKMKIEEPVATSLANWMSSPFASNRSEHQSTPFDSLHCDLPALVNSCSTGDSSVFSPASSIPGGPAVTPPLSASKLSPSHAHLEDAMWSPVSDVSLCDEARVLFPTSPLTTPPGSSPKSVAFFSPIRNLIQELDELQ